MSLGARIVIGIVALLCGISFLISAIDPDGTIKNPLMAYGITVFCFSIAIACFFPQSHSITLRFISGAIFIGFASYVIESFGTEKLDRALMGFIVWGLPSGYVMIMGRFPSWGTASQVFNNRSKKK